MEDAELCAGVCEVCNTPPIGVELAGYGPGRDRFSTGIHDHLMGQALVLDDGQRRIALVTSDLLGISPDFAAAVRREAETRTGIPAGNIMVTATHTHTAPTTGPTRECGYPDVDYVRMAARHLAGAVVGAVNALRPARLRIGEGEHRRLAWNRVGGQTVDYGLTVLCVEDAEQDGKMLALLVHYACHPVILGPKFTISADYPGAMRDSLKRYYPGSVVLFANGTCGNIDPITNREVWGRGSFEDVEQAGEALAEDARRVASSAHLVRQNQIGVAHDAARLEYNLPDLATLQANITKYRREARQSAGRSEAIEGVVSGIPPMPRFWYGYYRDLHKRLKQGKLRAHDMAELQVFSVGDQIAVLGIPAEVYAEQGLAIRRLSRYRFTLAVCYANGLYGYLPPREAFESGSYAALLAAAVFDRPPFRPNVTEALLDATARLLK